MMLPVLIKKSNELCRAKWSPKSINEPRLVALVAAQIHPDDTDFQIYRIPIGDVLQEEAHDLGGENYKRLKELARNIVGSTITLEKKNGKGFAVYGLFSKCEYEDGAFHVHFHPDLKSHYLELQEHFTTYNLLDFMQLTSIYSQRIFEILKSWDDLPEVTLSIPDLQERLSVPPSLKENFKNFRLRVLEPAHKEISKKTSLSYDWETVKKGRKVIAIRFVFSKNRVLPVAEKKKKIETGKTVAKNNKIFAEVMSCHAKSGGDCGEDRGKDHCSFCRMANPQQLTFPDLKMS
jgi:plasmid replication initiation protein